MTSVCTMKRGSNEIFSFPLACRMELRLPSPVWNRVLHGTKSYGSKCRFDYNPFLLSLVCTNSCRLSGLSTLLTVFISCAQSFSPCRSFPHRSSTPVSVNEPPSVIAAWQALYRHSKSPHWSSFTMVSGAIIIIIIIDLNTTWHTYMTVDHMCYDSYMETLCC